MKTSETLCELAAALAQAQGEMDVAKKDNLNTFFTKGNSKSKYADINNVLVACRAALSKHGLAVIQAPSVTPERYLRMTTRLIHKSGEWVETELDFRPKEDTPQAIGSCCTYARRYSLQSMVGVIAEEEDDDGNAASIGSDVLKKHEERQQQARPVAVQQAPRPTLAPAPKREPKIFDKNDLTQANWLEGFLKDKGIASDSLLSVADHLHGKDLNTELMKAINEFKAQH